MHRKSFPWSYLVERAREPRVPQLEDLFTDLSGTGTIPRNCEPRLHSADSPVTIEFAEKRTLYATLKKRVEDEYFTLLAAQKATQQAATHEEARPENDKDTRALEQSYLARGQAERVITLKEDVDALSSLRVRAFPPDGKIALGAFVVLEDETGTEKYYLLAPAGAGETLPFKLGEAKVVTQKSPLGQALLGAQIGDDVEIQTPLGKRTLSVLALC